MQNKPYFTWLDYDNDVLRILSKTPNEAVYSSTVYRNAGGRNRNCFPIERVFWSSCDPFQVGNDAVFFILVIRVV